MLAWIRKRQPNASQPTYNIYGATWPKVIVKRLKKHLNQPVWTKSIAPLLVEWLAYARELNDSEQDEKAIRTRQGEIGLLKRLIALKSDANREVPDIDDDLDAELEEEKP